MVPGCWLQVDEGQSTKGEHHHWIEAFGGLECGFGVGAKVMDDVPELEAMLEAVRRQDIFDHLGSEAMAGTTPKCSQPKLCIGVHRRSFQKTLLRVKELADKRVVQPRLPFLNEGKFETAKVRTACKKRDWSPHKKVLLFSPKSKS